MTSLAETDQWKTLIHPRRFLNYWYMELFTQSLIVNCDEFTLGDQLTKHQGHYLEFLCSLFADLPPPLSACDPCCIHAAMLTMQVRKFWAQPIVCGRERGRSYGWKFLQNFPLRPFKSFTHWTGIHTRVALVISCQTIVWQPLCAGNNIGITS